MVKALYQPRLIFAAFCTVWVCSFLVLGIMLRLWLWHASAPVRFYHDINNGFHQGLRVLRVADELSGTQQKQGEPVPLVTFFHALVVNYDRVYEAGRHNNRFDLDYTPARLAVMGLWMRGVRADRPDVTDYSDEFVPPLLVFNSFCGFAAAGGCFLLVRQLLRQSQLAADMPAGHWPWVAGFISASLVWFNPVLLLNAHAWPQWDVWLLPFFFFGAWCAAIGRWGTAGLLIALGAMFKGQMLMAAPVILLYPLLRGQWKEAMRLAAGFVTGIACITFPWLMREPAAWAWAGLIMLGSAVAWATHQRRSLTWARAYQGVSLVMLVLGVAVFLAALKFPASWSWYYVGIAFPTENWREMSMGPTSNLPAILGRIYRWNLHSPVPGLSVAALGLESVSIRQLLRAVYFLLILLIAWGMSRAAGREPTRLILGYSAAWVVAFAVLPQMHERYLLWGSVVSAAAVCVHRAGWPMHLLTTFLALLMTAHQLLDQSGSFAPELLQAIRRTCPDIGWATTLLAGVWVWLALFGQTKRPATNLSRA